MRQFQYITNPNTNRKCRVSSPLGRRIINNYIKRTQLGGCGAGACALPMVGGGCAYTKKNNRCKKSDVDEPELCQLNSTGRCAVRKTAAPTAVVRAASPKPVAKAPSPKAVVRAASPKPVAKAPSPKPVARAASPKRVHQRSPSSLLVGEPSPKPVARKSGKSCDVSECIEITEANCRTPSVLKKYKSRPSPPYPAVPCAGKKLVGKDGKTMYISKLAGKSYRWVKA